MAENMIKFLRGNVANLPQTATAGAVYFTKDEGLYLGLEDGSYHRYGDFITVDNVDSLPAAGAHEKAMYYCVAENILAKWDGEKWVQINKQKTLAELGGVAKSVYEAKMAALEKADTDNATAISNLSTYVGTIPEGVTATNVVAYVQEKTAGIATSANLEELSGRVTIAEGDIDKLEASLAEGGATANAIAAAKASGDNAQADVDALELKVGTIEDGKTVAGLIADAQTAAGNAQGAADAAQGDVDDLAAKVGDVAEGKTVVQMIADAQTAATYDDAEVRGLISDNAGAIDAIEADYLKAADKTELQTNIDKKADQTALDAVTADYLKAADKTELQGNIDKKVDQVAYDAKVAALEGEDARLAGLISDMDTAYKAADNALDGRVTILEGTITGLSGAMHFKGVESALPTGDALANYADGDVIIVGDKEYVFNEGAFVEFGDVSAEGDRIAALEGIVGKEAEGENAATGLVKSVADNAAAIAAEKTRAEGKEAELLAADATNLQTAKDYADAAVAALKIEDYAKQADLDTHTGDAVAHITAAEREAWNAAEGNAKTYADGLNTAMDARVADLEAIDHDHSNKDELDKIADGDKAKWDEAYAKAHEHSNKTVLDGITAEKVTAWDGAQAAAEATAAAALAAAKTELEGKITASETAAKSHADTEVGKVQTALNEYKESNNAAVALKANAADVYTKSEVYAKTETYTKAEVEAMLTWGSF